MKPTLNEEIEMSSKGIDYVDSLVPIGKECVKKHNKPEFPKDRKEPNLLSIIVFAIVASSTVLWTI